MTKKNLLLVVDGVVNMLLGIMLIFFPAQLMFTFDLPKVETYFYVNILGAVLIGVGIALLLESSKERHNLTGLGIGGAIVINLCGAGMIILWLLFGNLELSPGGSVFLWSITLIVLGVAVAELLAKAWNE